MNKPVFVDRYSKLLRLRKALIILIAVTVVIMFFRVGNYLNAAQSKVSLRESEKLEEPFNFPLIESGTKVYLKDVTVKTGTSIDILEIFLGLLIGDSESRKWGTISLQQGDTVLLPVSELPLDVQFIMTEVSRTGGGYWRGESAELVFFGAINESYSGVPGRKDRTWSKVPERGKSISPFFHINIPAGAGLATGQPDEREVNVTAKITITRPVSVSLTHFRDSTITYDHKFKMRLLSPAELNEYRSKTDELYRKRISRAFYICVPLLCIPLILLLVVQISIVKQLKQHRSR